MKQALVLAAVVLSGCASTAEVSQHSATSGHCQLKVGSVTQLDGNTVSHTPERCIAWTFGPTRYEKELRKGNWLLGKRNRWDR